MPRLARILVVEDNPPLRILLDRRFRKAGYEVLTAESGPLGLEVALTEDIDLILLDMSLPEMDGWAVARGIRAVRGHALPIIGLTAHAMQGDQARVLAAGCTLYMTKPFDFKDLLEAVRRLLATEN